MVAVSRLAEPPVDAGAQAMQLRARGAWWARRARGGTLRQHTLTRGIARGRSLFEAGWTRDCPCNGSFGTVSNLEKQRRDEW